MRTPADLMPALLPWSATSLDVLASHAQNPLDLGPQGWRDDWYQEWLDPSQVQRPGLPRLLSLNGLIALHAPWADWETAWGRAHHDWQPGGLLDRRRAAALLQAANAVVHHPLGTVERFEECLQAWVALEQRNPQVTGEVWVERFWKTIAVAVDDRSATPDPLTAVRLRWVNQWLDATSSERRDDPAGLDRAWTWVQRWLDEGRLTLGQLVHRRYQVIPLAPPEDPEPDHWGNGLLMAWRHASAPAMDAWTRWERAWYGPAVVERQWYRALASLHPDNTRSTTPLLEHAAGQAPGPGDDREAAWVAWGVQRTLDGDPSPTGRTFPIPLYAKATQPPRVTLARWMASPALHPLAIPPEDAPRLLGAARAWERAELQRTSRLVAHEGVAPRSRPRL